MPDIAVVVVNWNSWDYLFSCLECLSRQTHQNFRTIVIDNNSKDKHPESTFAVYPRLTFIQNYKNTGFAAANNQAIRIANDCEWIVLLNPDTLPDEMWLENLYKASISHTKYTIFGSRLMMAGEPGILDGAGDVYHMSGLSWRYGHGVSLSLLNNVEYEIFSPCAAAAMYRRDQLLSVGGFDEDFFCYFEDVDLGFRLRHAGYRALYIPDSVVLHYGSGTTSKQSDFSVYYGHRNLVWTWVKNMPTALFFLFLPVHVLYTAGCIFLYAVRGQSRVIIKSKIDALKGLRFMWDKRKVIQRNSRISLTNLWNIINKCISVGPRSKYKRMS